MTLECSGDPEFEGFVVEPGYGLLQSVVVGMHEGGIVMLGLSKKIHNHILVAAFVLHVGAQNELVLILQNAHRHAQGGYPAPTSLC